MDKTAIQSLAPIKTQRTKEILGIDKVKIDTFDELKDFMLGALKLILPDSVFKKFTSAHLRQIFCVGSGKAGNASHIRA